MILCDINKIVAGGGALNFFRVGVCHPDFRSVGLANWYLPLKEGACELKIPNLGACELFLVNWLFYLKWEPLRTTGEAWKRGSSGPHIPVPLSSFLFPPPPGDRGCAMGLHDSLISANLCLVNVKAIPHPPRNVSGCDTLMTLSLLLRKIMRNSLGLHGANHAALPKMDNCY